MVNSALSGCRIYQLAISHHRCYNAKRNNKIIDLDTFEDNVSKVQSYCYEEKNFKVPIMKAVDDDGDAVVVAVDEPRRETCFCWRV